MASQPHVRPLQSSAVFADGQSARPEVFGTVPSGYTRNNMRVAPAQDFDPNAQELPFPLTREVLERGRERFNIYCAVCHERTGDGDGLVVRRGFSRPPSYHIDRLRQAPLGHFFDVMTNGYGAMPRYDAQVSAGDRWAIAAYIRALQLSRDATLDDVPPDKRAQLENGGQTK
jgi:mono/diheme cytochrome c family protein